MAPEQHSTDPTARDVDRIAEHGQIGYQALVDVIALRSGRGGRCKGEPQGLVQNAFEKPLKALPVRTTKSLADETQGLSLR